MSERPQNKHLKPFVKGQSGNPSGKPKQLLTKDKVKGILGKFADMTRSQLQDIVTDPKSTMLEIIIAAIMVKAAKDGDYGRLSFILDRSIGKIATEEDGRENADTSGMTVEEKIAWLKSRQKSAQQ